MMEYLSHHATSTSIDTYIFFVPFSLTERTAVVLSLSLSPSHAGSSYHFVHEATPH